MYYYNSIFRVIYFNYTTNVFNNSYSFNNLLKVARIKEKRFTILNQNFFKLNTA